MRKKPRGDDSDDDAISIGPAGPGDVEQGYPWRWEVVYGDEHRSGACQTRAQAEREAAIVLEILSSRPR